MEEKSTLWLVRTRSGEILGPFSQSALLERLESKAFSVEDEIAPSSGQWISAKVLTEREDDEWTQTSTRSQTITETAKQAKALALVTPDSEEEVTDILEVPYAGKHPSAPVLGRKKLPRRSLILLGILAAFFLWAGWLYLNSPHPVKQDIHLPKAKVEMENSPFVQQMMEWIAAGKRGEALSKLSEYHEKHRNEPEWEYRIPYAALLITDKESPGRAKKILQEILDSEAPPAIKGHAHRWLGYLQLSLDEEDMGESHFLEALQYDPRDVAARFNLGRAYLKQQRYKQSLAYLQLAEAEIENPQIWLIHIYKGRAKAAMGLMQDARVEFRTAMETAPDRWLTYIYFALFLKAIDEKPSARTILKRMFTRDPTYETLAPAPIDFYQEKVNYAEYLDSFQEVMRDAPQKEKELGQLYLTYLLKGPESQAGIQLVNLAKKGELAYQVIGLKVLLDTAASNEKLRNQVDALPFNLTPFGYYAYVLRGVAYAKLGLQDSAQKDFQKALLLEPKTAISRLSYAVLLEQLSRNSDAKSEFNNLLNYHPYYIPAIVHRF